MRIAFIHQGLATLPELEAYTNFFESRGHKTFICTNNRKPDFEPEVEWHFMGLGGGRMFNGTKLIHEYASASVPSMASLKDSFKRWFNTIPDFRIYLNDGVRESIRFNDTVPFGYRDMGVDLNFVNSSDSTEKLYDFIYPGSVQPYSFFKKLLMKFTTEEFKASKLLVISNLPSNIRSQWSRYENIEFRAPMSNQEVIGFIRQSKYGINFRPTVDPFTFQTATKVLEYAACKVPVISTPSKWLSKLKDQHGGSYFILSPGLENFTLSNLSNFSFEFPDVQDFNWKKQIIKSGVCKFLNIPVD